MADNGGWILFHFSARKGNYKLFAYFADMGTDIYFKTKDEKKCIHISVLYGNFNLCMSFTLEYRFDMNIDNNDRWTALHFSTNIGFRYR